MIYCINLLKLSGNFLGDLEPAIIFATVGHKIAELDDPNAKVIGKVKGT